MKHMVLCRLEISSSPLNPRFLHADPTPSALQVFSSRPGAVGLAATGIVTEEGSEKGVWINADPIPGCVVCNIGESAFLRHPWFLSSKY